MTHQIMTFACLEIELDNEILKLIKLPIGTKNA